MDFQLSTSLRAVNRMFNFAAFITAHATSVCVCVCVIRYDRLAMKLGPHVEELNSVIVFGL